MSPRNVSVLGIRIDNINFAEVNEKILLFLRSPTLRAIFTPNPEMLVKAQKDSYFTEVLNSGDINICDGFGIQLVTKGKIKRIPGVDLLKIISKIAEKNGKSVFFLGSGSDEVGGKLIQNIIAEFSNLKIAGFDKGPVITEGNDGKLNVLSEDNSEIIKKINDAQADVLFVAFGMGKQEKWIFENRDKLPNVKIAMGVGGAFDFISGVIPRAPKWMRKLGLEWLFRLYQQPKRIKRIWNATVKFIYLYY